MKVTRLCIGHQRVKCTLHLLGYLSVQTSRVAGHHHGGDNMDGKVLASLRGPSLSQSTYHVLRRGPLPWPERTAKEIENQVAN